jgi:uncharacterized protein (DUF58 family)
MVREFTRDDDWRVTVLFDPRVGKEDAAEPEFAEKFEAGVKLAASLISHFARAGAETRLITSEEDSGFGAGTSHSYKLYYQLARVAMITDADEAPESRRSRDNTTYGQFVIAIASAARTAQAVPRAVSTEFVSFEEL